MFNRDFKILDMRQTIFIINLIFAIVLFFSCNQTEIIKVQSPAFKRFAKFFAGKGIKNCFRLMAENYLFNYG